MPSWTKAGRGGGAGLDLGQFQSLAGPDLRLASAKCENIGQTWLQDSLHLFLVHSAPAPPGAFLTTELMEPRTSSPPGITREIPELRC